MNVSLIGPSGAGKGTYSGALVKELWLEHVATGDLFRQNLQDQTPLALCARKYMDRGELVPDEIVDAMVEDWVRKSDPAGDILFDGFPRTVYQARFLDDLLTSLGSPLDAVLLLNISETEMLRRLEGRLICRACKPRITPRCARQLARACAMDAVVNCSAVRTTHRCWRWRACGCSNAPPDQCWTITNRRAGFGSSRRTGRWSRSNGPSSTRWSHCGRAARR